MAKTSITKKIGGDIGRVLKETAENIGGKAVEKIFGGKKGPTKKEREKKAKDDARAARRSEAKEREAAKAKEKKELMDRFRVQAGDTARQIRDKGEAEVAGLNEDTKKIAATIMGFFGGVVSSPAKRVANKAKSIQYWQNVKAGKAKAPRR